MSEVSQPEPGPIAADSGSARPIRDVADGYVTRVAELDPRIATYIGLPVGEDRLPDLSPAGRAAMDELARSTLAELDAADREASPGPASTDAERLCGRLLRERLGADLATSEADEYLREVMNVYGLQERVQGIFLMMPTSTAEEWGSVTRRMTRVPEALAGLRESLSDDARRGLFTASPRQVVAVAEQLGQWVAAGDGRGWFADFTAAAEVPPSLRAELDTAAANAAEATAELRDWLRGDYLDEVRRTADGVGVERYRVWARFWNGANLDVEETYEWGWAQYHELQAQMQAEAHEVLPGATVRQAMDQLDEHGEAVEGEEELRARLQQVIDEVIRDLDGRYFDIPDPVKHFEVRIAPPGAAAAPYYNGPSEDFSRPGRTWIPTLGRTRFPLWSLLSTLYHEGVPGHHLQLGQWVYLAPQLSTFQTSVGGVDACIEGWALYAERLMDELGYLRTPGDRLGFLEGQMLRAIRVVIDIGMHLELTIPAESPMAAGQKWTPELGREFLAAHSGRPPEYLDSEIVRYLGLPGQAISYKIGERAWLRGLAAARAAHNARGENLDMKRWHMAALSLGCLGLDDLFDELSQL